MTTTLAPVTPVEVKAEEAGPGCGCCIPPPDASAKEEAMASLQARRERLERRLAGMSKRA